MHVHAAWPERLGGRSARLSSPVCVGVPFALDDFSNPDVHRRHVSRRLGGGWCSGWRGRGGRCLGGPAADHARPLLLQLQRVHGLAVRRVGCRGCALPAAAAPATLLLRGARREWGTLGGSAPAGGGATLQLFQRRRHFCRVPGACVRRREAVCVRAGGEGGLLPQPWAEGLRVGRFAQGGVWL